MASGKAHQEPSILVLDTPTSHPIPSGSLSNSLASTPSPHTLVDDPLTSAMCTLGSSKSSGPVYNVMVATVLRAPCRSSRALHDRPFGLQCALWTSVRVLSVHTAASVLKKRKIDGMGRVDASTGFNAAVSAGDGCCAHLALDPKGQPRPRPPQLPADAKIVVLDIEGATTLIRSAQAWR